MARCSANGGIKMLTAPICFPDSAGKAVVDTSFPISMR